MKKEDMKFPVYYGRPILQILIILIIAIISGFITYKSFKAYTVHHTYMLVIFGVSLAYFSWLASNPFAAICEDHFEVASGLFFVRKYYYRDLKDIKQQGNSIVLKYNGMETHTISIRMMKQQDKGKFFETIKFLIFKDAYERE